MNYKTLTVLLLITFNLQLTSVFAQQTTIDSLKQVITIAEQDTIKVKTLNELAIKYQRINLDTSLIYAEQALEIATKLFNKDEASKLARKGMSIAYKNVGVVHFFNKDYTAAINSWEKQLEIDEELGDKNRISKCCYNIGIVHRNQDNYTKAVIYYNKALKIEEELGNKKEMYKCYNNIGVAYRNQGSYVKAINFYSKALKIAEEHDDKTQMSRSYNNIGNVYNYQGNYTKAISSYNKALKFYEELEDKNGMSVCYNNIGSIYREQGNHTKAISYFRKTLIIAEAIGNTRIVSICYNNFGTVYSQQKNYKKAISYFNKSLKIKEEGGDKQGIARSYNNLGLAYSDSGSYTNSLYYFNKSLEIKKEIGNQYGIATSYVNISGLHLKLSDIAINRRQQMAELDTAIIFAKKSLKIITQLKISSYYEYDVLSRSYWGLRQNIKASNSFNDLINVDNADILMNFTFISENEKENFFKTIETHYWMYNSFVLQNKDSFPTMVEQVYNNTVKNKGLLLKSNTAMRNAIYSSNDSILIQEYDNWIVLKRQIAKDYSNGKDATVLENKADSLEGDLVKNSNEFSDFKKVQKISWKQIQTSLKENEVAIEFLQFALLNPDSSFTDFTNQIQYVALILTKNSQHPKMIPLFEEKQLEKIIGKFGGNNYSYINSIYGKKTEVNKALYNLIWKPMEASLQAAKKVYISPDGLLHKISFSAIAKEQDVYLCDVYDIEVKSSTGKITEQNHQMTQSNLMNTATLFGGINYDTDSTTQKIWNYLEGTKTETQKISKILKKGKVDINYYTNTNATEEEFKLMASNSDIIHIATHGFFYSDPNEIQKDKEENIEVGDVVFRGRGQGFGVESFVENRNPLMRSGLVFAGANDVWNKQSNDTNEDGVLTAQEVSNIDMRKADLVVMSACETGLGDIKGSEGVYGLQRAFKMAGVDYMIMSLWQVPDKETEEFMTTFYKKLIKQKDIKKAFVETQKEMRTKYDPYFWAAFVLIE